MKNRKSRNIITGVVVGVIVFSLFNTKNYLSASEEHHRFYEEALVLKELSLFQGTDNGFELDRYATRVEAGVIVVRLLGLESEAFEAHYEHPFLDVSSWADDYIGLLYYYQLTSGYDDTRYGAKDIVTPKQFMTFCLRALEYDDEAGDFFWEGSLEFAQKIGIIDSNFYEYLQNSSGIYRDDIVAIIYNLLNQKIKNSDEALIDRLIKAQVFEKNEAIQLGVYRQPSIFSLMTTVLEVANTNKMIVIDYRNDVDYIVEIPFSSSEISYVSYLLVEDLEGQQYQCYISYEVYLADQQYTQLKVGDDYYAYGSLIIPIVSADKIIDIKVEIVN